MAKTATHLKHKHRDRIWKDRNGELWYFNGLTKNWTTLVSLTYGNSRESAGFVPVAPQQSQDEAGPFTKVTTAVYWEEDSE